MLADSSKSVYKFYHFSSLVLVGLTPLALINPYESNFVSLPLDMLLGTNLLEISHPTKQSNKSHSAKRFLF